MHTDKFGQIIFSETDLIDIYLTDSESKMDNILMDNPISFDEELELESTPTIIKHVIRDMDIKTFDKLNQENWFMPDEYKNMDIAKFVLDQCQSDPELQRAGEELLLFQEKNMFMLLKYLKYLVDTMRNNNIVWGVGRGSSVSSFVLYLIGIHKINSLYYQLDISEFLK